MNECFKWDLTHHLPCYRNGSAQARSPEECPSSCSPSPEPSEQQGDMLDPRAILRSLGTRRRCRASSFLKQGRTRRGAEWATGVQIYEGSQSAEPRQDADQTCFKVRTFVWFFKIFFFFCKVWFGSLSKEGVMEWTLHCWLITHSTCSYFKTFGQFTNCSFKTICQLSFSVELLYLN